MSRKKFGTTAESDSRGHVSITVPFDPAEVWGKKKRHYVKGVINDHPFNGSLGVKKGRYFMPLNKQLRESAGISSGDVVTVVMEPDEPQADKLPEDFEQALANSPQAKEFFDTLTAFYRNQYTGWIVGAKKPETRTTRIEKVISLLEAGKKQR